MQRITVGVIVGALVLSLALSLLSTAGAAQLDAPGGAVAPVPAATSQPLVSTSGDPKPVTKTPQGQATQVTDKEHIGGLVAFIAFMLGGVLLLVRGRRRDRRERESAPILS